MSATDVIRKGASDLIILSLLRERDMYGYEIRKCISERSQGLFTLTEGALYVFLYRLSEDGYISERRQLVGKRRMRVYYHLEASGEKYLEELSEEYKQTARGLALFYAYEGESDHDE